MGYRARFWQWSSISAALLVASSSAANAPTITGDLGELSDSSRKVLTEIFRKAGVSQVKARSVERTPERQVTVMLNLAIEDLERAKAMYCDAGDEVLAQFDPNATREKNHAVMLKTLLGVLPKAREAGCLNHVRNDDVISVDVATQEVPSAQWDALVKAAEAAVAAKKVERFLAPPREPEAFHFEFARNTGVSSSAVEKGKPKAAKPSPVRQ